MEDSDARDYSAIALEFLVRYYEDVQAGRVRSLADYQHQFPGHEELISHEHDAVVSRARHGPTDGSGEDSPPAAAAGDLEPIEGFRIERLLGTGGMGAVYRATQLEPFQRKVALKVIRPDLGSAEVVARFKKESQALALMDHPNVARVFDAGASSDGRSYFIMEYVEGTSITEYADRQRLGIRERLTLFAQACDGVAHVHRKGIIHRDLKPSNMLVAETERGPVVKVIDFGIAKSVRGDLAESALRTQFGQVLGSPAYMSPEQARGTEKVDRRADVYGLGVVLFELLTGTVPFDPQTWEEIEEDVFWKRLVEKTAITPSRYLARRSDDLARRAAESLGLSVEALLRELRGDLDWIVHRATENDPSLRYSTVEELLDHVSRYLADLPLKEAGGRAFYYARKFARRNRFALAATAAAAVLALVAALGSVIALRAAREGTARTALNEGMVLLATREALDDDIRQLRGEIAELEARTPGFTPAWELSDLLARRRRLDELTRKIDRTTALAERSFLQAIDSAPKGPSAAAASREYLRLQNELYGESLQWNGKRLSSDYFEVRRSDVDSEERVPSPKDPIRFRLEIVPPEAEVHVFRYEEVEGRLYPFPFDAAMGRPFGEPRLVVSKIFARREAWKKGWPGYDLLFPFEPGDTVDSVGAAPVRTLGDLARELARVAPDQKVEVTVEHAGEKKRREWIPWPSFMQKYVPFEPGRLIDPFRQLSVEFEPQPLALSSRTRLHTDGGICAVDLPPGSYLLVAAAEGFADARYPVASPWPEGDRALELVREADVPSGFLYIPGGPASVGGDPEVDQSLPPRDVEVESFFMQGTETNFSEYIEFLLAVDPDENGTIERRAGWPPELEGIEPEFQRNESGLERVEVLPRARGQELLSIEEGKVRWHPPDYEGLYSRRPLFGISVVAALEFARWKTESAGGGRWLFRLPTALEWEKAARGVDRRPYVWGRYFVPSFARVLESKQPDVDIYDYGGTRPWDESVYGIRDLAGSVKEPTLDTAARRYAVFRGSSYLAGTDYYARAANRLGHLPDRSILDAGIRLVAERLEAPDER